eukprot:4929652-Prymnesium_polylepis.1
MRCAPAFCELSSRAAMSARMGVDASGSSVRAMSSADAQLEGRGGRASCCIVSSLSTPRRRRVRVCCGGERQGAPRCLQYHFCMEFQQSQNFNRLGCVKRRVQPCSARARSSG